MPSKRPEPSRLRRQLASELGELRSRMRLGMRPFADLVYPRDPDARPASQRVQRVENGQLLPSLDEVSRWLDIADATPADRKRVMTTAHYAHAERTKWADLLESYGGRHLNELAEGDERTSGLNSSYQQFIVPGLLQTEQYARALLPHLSATVDPEVHIPGLLERQRILDKADRVFRFVLTGRAWRWNPAAVDLDEQHARIRAADERPNVSVRVLADEAQPMGGYSSFTLYEQRDRESPAMVVVELEHGRVPLLGDDVDKYRRRFEDVYAAAAPVSRVS